jgi:hypothetical protein
MASIFTGADIILGATTIRQVTQTDTKTGQEHRKATNSGGAVVVQVSGKSGEEVTSFTSGDLAALVALNTSTFCSVGVASLSSTNTVPMKLRTHGGVFASGASHPWITGASCLVVPTSFEATQDGDFATCSADIHWISADGLASGFASAVSQTLGAQSFNAEHTLGPAYINAALLAGVQSIKVNPGIEVVKPPLGSGSLRPTHASIKMSTPTIEITVNDFAAITTTLGAFTAMTSANVYFKKRADSGTFTANITAEHIRFTLAAGLADTNNITISGNDDGSATITLHGKVLTASAVVAIP